MKNNPINDRQFLFCGEYKNKLFGKNKIPRVMIDDNLLWIRGYINSDNKLSTKLSDIRMKYLKIQTVEMIEGGEAPFIKIVGVPHRSDRQITVHLPNIKDATIAVDTIQEVIEVYQQNEADRLQALEDLRLCRNLPN